MQDRPNVVLEPSWTLARYGAVCAGAVVVLLSVGWDGWTPDRKVAAAWLLAATFGASVGAAELISRYKDRPVAAVSSLPALIYMAINAGSSLVAFWLLNTGRLAVPIDVFKGHHLLNSLAVGAFSSMAFFRTSLFNVKVGDTTLGVGPAAVLQIMLNVADRETDRLRAGPRAQQVRGIMADVVYEKARLTLPSYCFQLMQNVSLDERSALEQALTNLDSKTEITDQAKAYNLGLLLMNIVGEDVLARAVSGLAYLIKGPPKDEPKVLGRSGQVAVQDLVPMLEICRALEGPVPAGSLIDPGRDPALLETPTAISNESDRVVIVLARLRRRFGPEVVAAAITEILKGRVAPSRSPPTTRPTGSA